MVASVPVVQRRTIASGQGRLVARATAWHVGCESGGAMSPFRRPGGAAELRPLLEARESWFSIGLVSLVLLGVGCSVALEVRSGGGLDRERTLALLGVVAGGRLVVGDVRERWRARGRP